MMQELRRGILLGLIALVPQTGYTQDNGISGEDAIPPSIGSGNESVSAPGIKETSSEKVSSEITLPPEGDAEPISEPKSSLPSGRRRPGATFSIGLGQVSELGKYDHYDRLYGSKEKMGFIQSGYFLYSYGIDIGLSLKFGYFSAKGHPLRSLAGLEIPVKGNLPDTVELNRSQSIELTLVPVQTLIDFAYSPFPVSRRIVIRGWIGPEFLFVQEALKPNLPEGTAVPEGTSLVSKGWNQGVVTGIMLSFSINGIEPRSDYALTSLGIDRTYISPFYEVVTTTNDKMGNYDRKVYGINISFDGLR